MNAVCSNCSEFQPSDRLPAVGQCLTDGDRVLSQDTSCSRLQVIPGSRKRPTVAVLGKLRLSID